MPLSVRLPGPPSDLSLSSVLSCSFNRAPTFLACPRASAIRENLVGEARMFFTAFANDCDIRNVDRGFFLDNTAFDVALRIRPRMPLDHLDTLDHNFLLFGYHNQNAPCFTAILAAQDKDFVVLLDCRHCRHLNDLRSK